MEKPWAQNRRDIFLPCLPNQTAFIDAQRLTLKTLTGWSAPEEKTLVDLAACSSKNGHQEGSIGMKMKALAITTLPLGLWLVASLRIRIVWRPTPSFRSMEAQRFGVWGDGGYGEFFPVNLLGSANGWVKYCHGKWYDIVSGKLQKPVARPSIYNSDALRCSSKARTEDAIRPKNGRCVMTAGGRDSRFKSEEKCPSGGSSGEYRPGHPSQCERCVLTVRAPWTSNIRTYLGVILRHQRQRISREYM